MQAIERVSNTSNEIVFLLLLLFFMIFILRVLSYQKLKSEVFALFNISTIDNHNKADEEFTPFQMIFLTFNILLFTLAFFFLKIEYTPNFEPDIKTFGALLLVISSYFIVKKIVEIILLYLFNLKQGLQFYTTTKKETFNSLSIFHFVLIVFYTFQNISFTFYLISLFMLLIYRILIIVLKNNKLIFSKLFYFILYLCALEIAPLFVLFKMMF